jgi:hypothetical protein
MYLTTIKLIIVIISIRIITVIIVPILISAKWAAPVRIGQPAPILLFLLNTCYIMWKKT